jgi:sarcosine oxidase subunit alpha
MQRGAPVVVEIDGVPLEAFAGETLAAAMLASGRNRMRTDLHDHPRGLWCNMGTCSECFVERIDLRPARRIRACVTPVTDGMRLRTEGAGTDD